MRSSLIMRRTGAAAAIIGASLAFTAAAAPASAAPSAVHQVRAAGVIAKANVGAHAFEIVRKGERVYERYTLPNGTIGGEWNLSHSAPEARGVEIDSIGNWTGAKADEAFGRAGFEVSGIVFHTRASGDHAASMSADGFWIVAWRGLDFTQEHDFAYSATVHLVDGSSYEITG
ncbi:hypothetical protein Q7F20_11315 [Curtobacterium sp. A7_M15]|uniref:hypothetical protein n=1 Tax=Curtobacterium sp. A7_M15 TaxID=3065241 RepID=UPI002737CD7E|nr:hypothetical protein [Curtobacterium sp. A7_M15]MDP4333958.1 hypothetical protein [Curtobacterium sp. A7_M15]